VQAEIRPGLAKAPLEQMFKQTSTYKFGCASAGTDSDLARTLIQFHKSVKIKTAHVNARLEPSSSLHSGSTILKNKM
jgi:hypothetical protein